MRQIRGYLALASILMLAFFTGCTGQMPGDDVDTNPTGTAINTGSAIGNRYDMSAELERAAQTDKGLYRTGEDGEREKVTPYNTNYITGNPAGDVTLRNNTTTPDGIMENIEAAYGR